MWEYETSPLHAVAIARGCSLSGAVALATLRNGSPLSVPAVTPLPAVATQRQTPTATSRISASPIATSPSFGRRKAVSLVRAGAAPHPSLALTLFVRCGLRPPLCAQSPYKIVTASRCRHSCWVFALGRSGFGYAPKRLSAFGACRYSAPCGRYPTADTYSYKPYLRFAYRHIALVWSKKSGVARSGRGCAPSLARSYLICAVWATPSALRPISLQNSHRFTLSPLLLGVVLPRSLVGQSPLPLSLVSTLRPRVGGLQLPHSLQGANTDTP